jgi:putative ABC transport system permease protein
VSVTTIDRSGGDTDGCLSYPHFQLIAEGHQAFSSVAAFTNETFSFSDRGGEPMQLQAARVSWNFFDLLGVKPSMGRTFTAEEGKAGAKPVALISYELWHRHFSGRPNVAGQSISLDSTLYTIVGVLPVSFQFGLLGADTDIWTPRIDELNLATSQQIQGGTCYLNGIARLAPDVSIEQARAEMRILDRQYVRDFPKMGDADPKRPVDIVPLKTKLVGNFRTLFLMLAAAVALVLLIACANIAGLLLTRSLKRRREVAIRIALGARRKQLVMQFLTESVLLALLGGTVGVLLALASIRVLIYTAGQSFPAMTELPIGVDSTVLAFAFALSILTGLLFGLLPALHFSNTNVSAALREEGRGTAGARSRNGSRNLLVTGQIALSLILLVGAGLLMRSFILLETESPGFNAHGVLTMSIALPPSKYSKPDQMIGFFDQLVRTVEILPGVKAAAVSSALPINVARLTPILVEGQPAVPLPERPIITVQTFTSSYLRVMQIPLIKGRFFDTYDQHESSPVIVVNQSFAKKFFSGQDPIGKHVWIGRRPIPAQIVGVIGDIKNVSLSLSAQPEFDVPFSQLAWGRMNLILRTTGDPRSFTGAVRIQIAKLDKNLPVTAVQTIDELLAQASTQPRMIMILLTGFAGFALVLAIVGLYGAISYSVVQRTQEIGVRIALGATRGDLLRLVLGYGAAVTCVGIAIGIACSLLVTGAMEKLVYGISTQDPITFCVVAALFFVFGLLASYVPARRAMRVDVVEALRG